MITAVDTNVLLDIFEDDPEFADASETALRYCQQQGRLVVCDVVVAEIGSVFKDIDQAKLVFDRLSINFDALQEAAAFLGAQVFRRYRSSGGQRQRVAADFLVGAHAVAQTDRLLTRDRGFHRTYFKGLNVLDPTK